MSLQDILNAVPRPKILSIQELKDLDDADLRAVHEASDPVNLDDGVH
jgi:hypothetical protein